MHQFKTIKVFIVLAGSRWPDGLDSSLVSARQRIPVFVIITLSLQDFWKFLLQRELLCSLLHESRHLESGHRPELEESVRADTRGHRTELEESVTARGHHTCLTVSSSPSLSLSYHHYTQWPVDIQIFKASWKSSHFNYLYLWSFSFINSISMNVSWLKESSQSPIIEPNQRNFENSFRRSRMSLFPFIMKI